MQDHSVASGNRGGPHQARRLLAIAAALAFAPALSLAQASGATVIHGQASFATQGNQLTITTVNGAGTRHSAIDWQSFSVPQGSVTRFNQPDALSTSINRVLGADPSKILGTLSSNGRLVLVNPAGITVGQGAAVDTAGFTASTLRMSDADALAGRFASTAPCPARPCRWTAV
jgi:filamentous hemagglutinin family protein